MSTESVSSISRVWKFLGRERLQVISLSEEQVWIRKFQFKVQLRQYHRCLLHWRLQMSTEGHHRQQGCTLVIAPVVPHFQVVVKTQKKVARLTEEFLDPVIWEFFSNKRNRFFSCRSPTTLIFLDLEKLMAEFLTWEYHWVKLVETQDLIENK